MSNKMGRCAVAAAVTALALTGSAYGAGKSPNGDPGPAGNPNQPTSTPQANAPQGPAGNEQQKSASPEQSQGKSGQSQGKSGQSHGKSGQSHGKADQSHGKAAQPHGNSGTHGKSGSAPSRSNGSHANPTPGTPKPKENNGAPKGKITICHATKSVTNPYVEITISVNGLHGHGPAEDPHHHDGSWKDIIPAPAGGCPTTVEQPATSTPQTTQKQAPGTTENQTPAPATTTESTSFTLGDVAHYVAPGFGTTTPAPETGNQAVLGAQASGGSAPAGANEVLGANASGNTAPAAVQAAHATGTKSGSLPFTGFGVAFLVIVAAVALLGGFALRRAAATNRA